MHDGKATASNAVIKEEVKETFSEVTAPVKEEVTRETKKTTEEVKAPEVAEPKVIISKEVDEEVEKIKKNIDFCNEKNIPEALEEGGKFYNAFQKLLTSTVLKEQEVQKEMLTGLLPFNKRRMGEKIAELVNEVAKESEETFRKLTLLNDLEGIMAEMNASKKRYADKYVECQLLHMF